MIILSIETSCDETAVSIVRAEGEFPTAHYTILGNALRSQIEQHREYGGVFPTLAKRDHARALVPLFEHALAEAALPSIQKQNVDDVKWHTVETMLVREEELAHTLRDFLATHDVPHIDLIAVTTGPGLEPALWVGVNFARALSMLLDVPLVPTNHMEGHIFASLYRDGSLAEIPFPTLALLISGGHTEFVLMRDWQQYEKVGQTRDDAVGEAFDKVARLLGLPYPGGPEISRLATDARERNLPNVVTLPRPMIESDDLDTSFSGIKTAVRYSVQEKALTDDERAAIAREFEDAIVEVLLTKTKMAIERYGIKSVILGGGVTANTRIRDAFLHTEFPHEYPDVPVHIPDTGLSTDNSIMIALAGHAHVAQALTPTELADIKAEGNKAHRRIEIGTHLFR